ncbi:MAG: hypothetical protein ACE5II_04095 [Anaerolineae bacterium]
MQDRTYAIAFLLILAIICLGAYVAVTTVLFRPRVPTISLGTPSPPTSLEVTSTPTLPLFPTPTSLPSLVTPVAPTPTPLPPATPTPSPSPTPTPEPSPTAPTPTPAPPTPVGGFLYRLLSIEGPNCQRGAYIRGRVYDAQGKGEPGVRVHLFNPWGYSEIKETKGDPDNRGEYDFVLGPDSARFNIEIVNSAGQAISATWDIDYQGGCTAFVNWQRME